VTARTLARVAAALAALAFVVSLAACTKSSPKQDTSSTSSSAPSTPTRSIDQTGPVSVGNITEKTTSSCPYLSFDTAKNDAGMRLQRIATLHQNGKVVGCRFFPAVFTSEKLPPTSQVVIEIVVSEYANHTAANNAFIRIAEAGKNFQQEEVATGNTGLCYETTLWAKDQGTDWACTFSKGTKVVVIRTVVNGSSFNVVQLAKAVYPKV